MSYLSESEKRWKKLRVTVLLCQFEAKVNRDDDRLVAQFELDEGLISTSLQ